MRKYSLSLLKKGFLIAVRPWLWTFRPLDEAGLDDDPIVEFAKWYALAKRCFWLAFPEAMSLSTVDAGGCPEGRLVLLKGYDRLGFVFYTNTLSQKGRALQARPKAALTFYWESLQRQIRIQGDVTPVSDKEADEYFATRWRLSQLGAWASKQSEPVASRAVLENRLREFKAKFTGGPVPRPPHWSGYRVVPQRVEFWKLRPNRLHDRFLYTRSSDGGWKRDRLYP